MTRRWRELGVLACLLLMACRQPKKVGQLVVSIQTDMSLPQQIDTIRVQVLGRGQTLLLQEYGVGTTEENKIPATLTVLAGKDPSLPVTIRVSGGKHNGVWRTFRETITTVPADRTASLRMPVQWLCDGTAKAGTEMDAEGHQVISSTCGDGNTCIAGKCVASMVPEVMLPDYQPQQVFGGAAEPAQGTCFDTVPCMSGGTLVEPVDADCTIARPAGVDALNVALRVASDGICDSTGNTCFVPLDGNSPEGWRVNGDRLALPRAACDKLKRGTISGVYLSTSCSTKTESIPPCGPWSSVQGKMAAPTVDAGAPPTASRVVDLRGDMGTALPCCPLMSDGKLLYTCMCATRSSGTLVSIDPAGPTVKAVIDLPVNPARTSPYFSTALLDGTAFWVDAYANTIERASIAGDGKRWPSLAVNGEITEVTPILVDASAMYLLASAVVGAQGSPVQLLKIDRLTGNVTSQDTGSNFHVHQFAQDATSIYMVSDLDTDMGAATRRTSRVVRIAKAGGAPEEIVPAMSVTTPDQLHGGFIGVHADAAGAPGLYSLYEEAPAAGNVLTRVVKIDPMARTLAPLVERTLALGGSTLWLLGAVDGAVLLARTESEGGDAGPSSIRSSSVIVLPARGGAPRIVADYARDYPLLGMQVVAVDADWVYWLNSTGELFRLARGALQ